MTRKTKHWAKIWGLFAAGLVFQYVAGGWTAALGTFIGIGACMVFFTWLEH